MESDIELKEVTKADIELIRCWRNSEEVSKYMYTNSYISEEQQAEWYSRIQADPTQKAWLITHENKKLGLASIYNIKSDLKTCYWAFYLGDTTIRGAGIGSKVEYNVLKYVFENMKFNKLLCEVFTFNEAVIKMHEKFGFRREGYFREHIFKNEKYYDVISLAMLKSEWDQIKEAIYKKVYLR